MSSNSHNHTIDIETGVSSNTHHQLDLDPPFDMGQRMGVFLVARVCRSFGGQYSQHTCYTSAYRCVGAFHHQFATGDQPVRALYRFFGLLRQRENRAAALSELRWLDALARQGRDPLDPAIPCPYLLALLAISWTTDLEHETYISGRMFANGIVDCRKGCWDRGVCTVCHRISPCADVELT